MTFLSALRYFRIVPVVPPLFLLAFAIVIVAAALRLTSNPSAAGEALTPLLLLQILVASSGFRFAARRGYYDLLLTSATPRWQIALAHCIVSIAPGVVSWFCIAAVEVAASRGTAFASAASGTCTAFIGSSLVAWSMAVFSSRMASAVGWLLLVTMLPMARITSPLQLLGTSVTTAGPVAVSAAYLGILVTFGTAMLAIVHGPTPLEAAQ